MNIFKNRSLRLRLMVVISFTAVLIWLLSTAVAWLQVRKEVNEVFDAQQILFAERLASSDLKTILMERHPHQPPHRKRGGFKPTSFDDDALAFAVFSARGEMLLHDGKQGENFFFAPKKGFSHTRLNSDDHDEWRIFWLPAAEGRIIIAVGQELDYRDDLVEETVLSQMWIWLAGLPLLIGLMLWFINRELRSLKQIGEQVAARKPDDTELLSTAVPKEIAPLIHSLNHFFERTATQLQRERRFTSDAAHELRSPLAGLKIQTELAQMAGEDATMRENALNNLNQGIDRATQLIEQLLTLSRLDNLQALDGVEKIDWETLIRSLIAERYFSAQKRQIELSFSATETPPELYGQPLLLSLMLRNLLDNAIHYCQAGSLVKIRLTHEGILLLDNGGGVADTDLPKLGQRFYRPAGQNEKGSGLGLSIVQRIAELHHCRVHIENSDELGRKGLKIRILWE